MPKSPTRLYHCLDDGDVLFGNSQVAYNAFKAAGAESVELISTNGIGSHAVCASDFVLSEIKLWFDSLRR